MVGTQDVREHKQSTDKGRSPISRNLRESQLITVVKRTREMFATDSNGRKLSDRERLRRDLAIRPAEADSTVLGSEYKRCAVEGFGEALLRGMGWQPGRAIGLGHADKVDVAPTAMERRVSRLGLGAAPRPWMQTKKQIEGQNAAGPSEGAMVGVTKGPYVGDVGRVTDVVGSMLTLQLDRFGTKEVPRSFVLPLESVEAFTSFTRNHCTPRDTGVLERTSGEGTRSQPRRGPSRKRSRSRSRSPSRGRSRSRSRDRRQSHRRSRERSGRHSRRRRSHSRDADRPSFADSVQSYRDVQRRQSKIEHETRGPPSRHRNRKTRGALWLSNGLRVRIISKRVAEGVHWNKTGVVTDVLDARTGRCVLQLDGTGGTIEGLKQRSLQTIVPNVGGVVRVVGGKERGSLGTVVERDASRGRVSVLFRESCETARLAFDDVCDVANGQR